MATQVTYTYLKDNSVLDLQCPSIEIPAQYPSEWFDQHPGAKPTAQYTQATDQLSKAFDLVIAGIKAHKLNVQVVMNCIHLFFTEISEVTPDDWISFNRSIGKKGDAVTPWSIIDVNPVEGGIMELTTGSCDKKDYIWIICFLLSAHRLSGINIQDYEEQVKTRIFDMMKNYNCNYQVFPPKVVYETWALDKSYCKMIAAIDMFFSRFPDHVLSPLRICTLRSRYRDCAGLLSIGYFSGLVSLKSDAAIAEWVYTDKVGQELKRMSHPGQELTLPDSYFPYQTDLGLVRKTHYSAVNNPHTYFLVHAVGTLLHSDRSKNARMLTDKNLPNNTQNAKMISIAFSSTFSLGKIFKRSDEVQRQEVSEGSESMTIDPPTVPDGVAWYEWFAAMDFQIPDDMVPIIENAKTKIGDTREGTIGEYVKNHF